MQRTPFRPALATVAALLLAAAGSAQAQVTIDQNKALAGNITPGDAPGFPITITRAGHYRLTGNLTVPGGVGGIVVDAPNVTIDLNGFTVSGPVTCTWGGPSAGTSCSAVSSVDGVSFNFTGGVLRNGTVTGFNYGVYGAGLTISNLQATQNSSSGIYVVGGTVSHVSTFLNGAHGLYAEVGSAGGTDTLIQNARSGQNHLNGFRLSANVVLMDSIAQNNGQRGIVNGNVSRTVATDNTAGNVQNVRSLGGNLNGTTVY